MMMIDVAGEDMSTLDLGSHLRKFGYLLLAITAAVILIACGKTTDQPAANSNEVHLVKFDIPNSIKTEHEELHRALEAIIGSGGKTGQAAQVVADRLAPHFEKEEEFALPPLAILSPLAQGRTVERGDEIIALSSKLKAELPQMYSEHKAIVLALDILEVEGKNENKPAAIEFTEKLKLHAQSEEEILYPAAILVGENLRMRPAK